jgi:class 3 adenylate cyclase
MAFYVFRALNKGASVKALVGKRHIAVLFSDRVSSVPLSARLDPEDLRKLLDTFRAAVVAAVRDKCAD